MDMIGRIRRLHARKNKSEREISRMTGLSRHTVAERLYARGADEAQVGLLLGIAERSAVREQFPRRQRTLEELTADIV